MKTIKLDGLDLKITEEDLSYDEAIKMIPEGYRMITLSTLAFIQEKAGTSKLDFWFWIKNYSWNKAEWRPVVRGYGDYYFDLVALDDYDPRASRGVYVKVK
uniref:Uncharacterized protein n=1 Tax=viral metagenome TaxID=1070528 RepID=A0A6H2A453_9ZZZZ